MGRTKDGMPEERCSKQNWLAKMELIGDSAYAYSFGFSNSGVMHKVWSSDLIKPEYQFLI